MIRYLCDLIVESSWDMSMMWDKEKMIEKSIRKIVYRMRDMHCEHTSMRRVQNRAFLIWLSSVRERNRLVCEKIKYLQHWLFFFLIEFLLSSWSSFCSARSRCNDCIVRSPEAILCDFNEYVMTSYSTLSRSCTIWHQVLVVTDSIRFFEAILMWLLTV